MDADDLKDENTRAVERLHECRAQRTDTIRVTERFQGRTVWDGEVEIFDLVGHPSATRCYAWSHPTGGGRQKFYAVLHLPPIDSPVAAVRAAIASQFYGST